MIAPLQLLDFESELQAYERLVAEPVPDDIDMGIGLGVEFNMEFDDDREALCVRLTVQFNAEEEIPDDIRPYVMHRGKIHVTGWLTWISEDFAARDDARRLLLVNGLSMLFGIARVRVADLTAGSDRRLVIPSISFKPIVEDFLEEDGNEIGENTSSGASAESNSSSDG
jgi:preprotein translocase subunit SecB